MLLESLHTCIKYSDSWKNLSKGSSASALVTVRGAFHTFIQNPNVFYTVQEYDCLAIIQGYSREDLMPYVAVLNARALS